MDELERKVTAPLGEVTVAGRPECVAVLRGAAQALVALVAPEAADAAELVCSELGGNAVRHSRSGEPGQTMTLHVHDEGETVRLALTDRGSRGARPQIAVSADPLELHGRGLFLVQAISKEWGVEYGSDGSTTVWSRLDVVAGVS